MPEVSRPGSVSGDRVFDYAAGELLIAQLDLPVTGQMPAASAEFPLLGTGILSEQASLAPPDRGPPAGDGRQPGQRPGGTGRSPRCHRHAHTSGGQAGDQCGLEQGLPGVEPDTVASRRAASSVLTAPVGGQCVRCPRDPAFPIVQAASSRAYGLRICLPHSRSLSTAVRRAASAASPHSERIVST